MENKRFAWLPVRMTSGKNTWLTHYYEHVELYDKITGRPPVTGLHFIWTETAEEKTWRLLKESIVYNRNIWNDYNYTKKDTS